jgi:hypothetical protein
MCQASTCVGCGEPGEPCCSGSTCNGGGCCNPETLSCVAPDAVCTSAGAAGEVRCKDGRCLCGANGEPCCPGPGGTRTCAVGNLCAPDPLDPAKESCVACGAVDQPCCDGIRCAAPAVCDATKRCAVCGEENAPCCGTGACAAPGLVCVRDQFARPTTCQSCGAPGERCCAGLTCNGDACCVQSAREATCAAAGDSCYGDSCDDGSCGGCGGTGQPCCSVGGKLLCTAPGATCAGTTCQPCGREGEPCCYVNQATSGNGCEAPLRCDQTTFVCGG